MDKVLIRMVAAEAPKPEVIFVGSADNAEAMLFRAIYNAEGGFGKVEDELGIHITVNETCTEIHTDTKYKKIVPSIKEVHYFLQNAKEC